MIVDVSYIWLVVTNSCQQEHVESWSNCKTQWHQTGDVGEGFVWRMVCLLMLP